MKLLGLHGAAGKMGREIICALASSAELQLGAAVVSPTCANLGQSANAALKYATISEALVGSCDVWVDFSSRSGALELAEICARHAKPLLIGTTGFTQTELDRLKGFAQHCALLLAANTSPAVFLLNHLSAKTQQFLGQEFDIEIIEAHHRNKKDAPSGTALALAQNLSQGDTSRLELGRSGKGERKHSSIGISSVRGGDVVGEHRVCFLGRGERFEIEHVVTDRAIFARGALTLAHRLVGAPSGFYLPADFYAKML